MLLSDDAFKALAEPLNDGTQIKISTGTVDTIDNVWLKVKNTSDNLMGKKFRLNINDVEIAIHTSLQWMIMHELNHFQLGHFRINGGACFGVNIFGLSSRDGIAPNLIESLSKTDQLKAPLCLELQADQDATEIILGAYSKDNWDLFRAYACCVFVVMILIEREERSVENKGKTHPIAATRIFMLMAHLAELWSLPAVKRAHNEGLHEVPPDYLPPDDEIDQYFEQVVAAAFSDIQIIANAADMRSIWDDLGGADAFFDDIRITQTISDPEPSLFKTCGGRQWAELKPTNAKVLALLGH